jgi:hypothetical protein
VGALEFPFLQSVQTGDHSASYLIGFRGLFHRG